METGMIKVTCTRCGGSGRYSSNAIHGTKCYGCNGSGSILVEPKKHAMAQTAKAKRAVKRAEDFAAREAHIVAGNERNALVIEKYREDSRIGPRTRERCQQYPAVMWETCRALQLFDAGSKVFINRLAE